VEKITVQNTALLMGWDTLMSWIFSTAGKGKPNSAWRKVGKLAAWCSHKGITLSMLTPELTCKFYTWLMDESGLAKPRSLYSAIRKSWEDLAASDKVPQVTFYRPPHKWSKFGIRTKDLPPNLKEALDDLANRSRDGKGENMPLRLDETTLQNRLGACERFLGFIANEMDEDLTSFKLEHFFEGMEYIKRFHEFKVARKDGKLMVGHLDELQNLVWIGERYVSKFCGPVNMEWLRTYIRRVKKSAQRRKDYGRYIEEKEVQKVIDAMRDMLKQAREKGFTANHRLPLARDLFAIQFFLDHGNRTSDLINAQMGKNIITDGEEYQCCFRTKNQVEDRFLMSIPAAKLLNDYYAVRKEMGIENIHVMITRNGKQLTKEQLHDQIQDRFQSILHIQFSTHWFRYTFLTSEIKRHGDPELAALRMGNKSASTAMKHYDRLAAEQVAPDWHIILESELNGGPGGLLHWAKQLLQRAIQDAKLAQLIKNELRKYQEEITEYEMSYV